MSLTSNWIPNIITATFMFGRPYDRKDKISFLMSHYLNKFVCSLEYNYCLLLE